MLDEELIIALGRVVVALTGTVYELEIENKDLLAEVVVTNLRSALTPAGKTQLGVKTKTMFASFPVDEWGLEVDRLRECLKKTQVRKVDELHGGMLQVFDKTLTTFRSDLDEVSRKQLLDEIEARLNDARTEE